MLTSHVKKILVLALILIAAASYWSYSFIDGDSPLDNLSKSERLDLKKNIVVLGVDERPSEEDTGRSDTLFVVMLDSDNNNVSLPTMFPCFPCRAIQGLKFPVTAGIKLTMPLPLAGISLRSRPRKNFWEYASITML